MIKVTVAEATIPLSLLNLCRFKFSRLKIWLSTRVSGARQTFTLP